MRGVKVAWSADLGLPVNPAVRSALAPARQVLVDLGCEVTDAAPDLSGADETFRAWRAFRFATAYAPLLREHRDQLGPNVAWNIERGLELTAGELSSATALRAALAERVGEFFATAEVLACPVTPGPAVRRHDRLGARDRRCATADLSGLDGVVLPDLGHRAAGHLGASGVHPGWAAGGAPAGRPLAGGLAAAGCGARLRGRDRPRQAHPRACRPRPSHARRASATFITLTRQQLQHPPDLELTAKARHAPAPPPLVTEGAGGGRSPMGGCSQDFYGAAGIFTVRSCGAGVASR